MTATAYVKQWAKATYGGIETVNTFNLAAAPTPGNLLVALIAVDAGYTHTPLPGNGVWARYYRQNGTHAFTVLTRVAQPGDPAGFGFTGGTSSDGKRTDGYLLELTGTDLSRGLSLAVSSAYDVHGLDVGLADASSPFQRETQPPDVLAVSLSFLTGPSNAQPITQGSTLDVTLTQDSTGTPSTSLYPSVTRSALFLREVTDLTADDTVPGARITADPDGTPLGGMAMERMSVGMLILPLGPVTTTADAGFNIVQDQGVCTFLPVHEDGTHLWVFGDGSANSTAVKPTHTYVPGTYTVTHTWTDAKGVSATATKTFDARGKGDRLTAMKDVLRLEVSPSGAAWTDVIATCTQVSTRREILGVGTLTATFKGTGFDPATSNTLTVGHRLRLMALDGATWKPLWVGQISEARLVDEGVQLEGVDNTAVLARTPYAECVRGFDEIGPALAASGLTYTAPAQTTPFTVAQIAKGTVLDQLLITRDTVKGHAWVDRSGAVKVVSTRAAGVVGTFTEATYSRLTVDRNLDQIVNDMTVKFLRYLPNSGACEPIEYGPFRNGASVTALGSRSAAYTIVGAYEDGGEIAAYADSILNVNAYYAVAPSSLRFPVLRTGDVTPAKALVDLNDLVTVRNTAKGIDQGMRVAVVAHTITPGTWLVDLDLDVDGYVARPIVTTEPTGDTHSHFLEQLYDVYTDNTGSGPADGSHLSYYEPEDLWVADDTGPRGNVGSTSLTASSGTLATTASPGTTCMTVDVPVVAGRKYRITALTHAQSSVAADRIALMLYAGSTRVMLAQVNCPAAATSFAGTVWADWTATSTGTVTFQLRAYRSAGTGNASLAGSASQPCLLDIDDVGKP